MNYIKHLAGFFDRVAGDERLNPTHVSMYVSLFQFWNANRFENPISIARSELMRVSKISAKATYHKCLKELHDYGYLRYKPSFNPLKGSLVYLFNFQTGHEQVAGRSRTKSRTGGEQALGPFINSININKQENIINGEEKIDEVKMLQSAQMLRPFDPSPSSGQAKLRVNSAQHDNASRVEERKEKSCGQKEKSRSLEEVQGYFSLQGYGPENGARFYHYMNSIGWVIGGKSPIVDWTSAAESWMLNKKTVSNESDRSKRGRGTGYTETDKDYSEPL